MKSILRATALFLVVMALIWVTFAHAGSMSLLGVGKPVTASVAFQGAGDVMPSASALYSFRAYSAATRGNAVVNICNVSDVACVDMVTDATTGDLVVTTVGGSSCSVVVCTVKTMYDLTGHGFDITQATIGNRPTFTVNCIGGKPCATFVSASSQALFSSFSGPWTNQPVTVSFVAKRPTPGASNSVVGDDAGVRFGFDPAANTATLYATGGTTATALDASWHAIQGVLNGASSDLNVDGGANPVNPGTTNPGFRFILGADNGGGDYHNGTVTESGVWPVAFTSGQSSSMSANQHTYWGF